MELLLESDAIRISSCLSETEERALADDVLDGLTRPFKELPPKHFYDAIEVRPDGSKAYVLQVNRMEYRSFRMQTLYGGISDQLAGAGGETSPPADVSRGLSLGSWQQANGSPEMEALVKDAEPSVRYGNSASIAVVGNSPDDFQRAVTGALTASSKLLALPSTPAALIPDNVQRLDQLFAATMEEGTSFILPRSRRGLLSFDDEDGTDAVL